MKPLSRTAFLSITLLFSLSAVQTASAGYDPKKKVFDCKGEADGEYIDPSTCKASAICKDGQFKAKPCPGGQVINTGQPPPWKCQPVEDAGMTADCRVVPRKAVINTGK